ncbi:MAG TPA: sigma-70 family RNA polymerase sigma factor [Polyangiaceae bacterium]|nr:sigma-70 family RNA polymerase sigma factor [Polyangiaceae bacterium]
MKPLTLVNAKIDSPELSAQAAAVDARPREIPAFREIFETHAPYVWRTLRRLGVHDADAKDMCQEVFVVVHRRLPDFEATSSVKTWVYGIAIRVASQYRRRARHRSEELSADLPEVSVPPEQEIDFRRREFLGRLDRALDRLDHHKRSVFVLFELEDMTMNEVAQTLGCPLQTAYSRLHAARALVREAFASMDAPKGDE